MKIFSAFAILVCILACKHSNSPTATVTPGDKNDSIVMLPNGWKISPAGHSLPLGDLPLNILLSLDGHYLISTDNGYSPPTLTIVSLDSEKVIQSFRIADAWLGMTWNADGKVLFASGGHRNRIYELNFDMGKLSYRDSIILGKPWPEEIGVTGICISQDGKTLFACSKENESLYVIDISSRKILKQVDLPGESYSCITSHDGKSIFISVWGKGEVLAYNTSTNKISDSVKVGNHPNAMAITKDDRTLFVSNANDNTVSVVDLEKKNVVSVLNVAVHPTDLAGSTPNALCLSADEKFLFIANADNNCLAVIDVHEPLNPKSVGFIPTGWYPTAIAVAANKIYVANGKGNSSFPNPGGPVPGEPDTIPDVQYIGGMLKGTLSIIDFPSTDQLKQYTQQVFRNTPFKNADSTHNESWAMENPIPQKANQSSAIKHVFYIIKENRTYDQVLGDVKEGNGDSSLCLFPQKVTPNLHAIAHDFVLLDNFYVNAEVSADGHNWSTAAYATDYIEKTWPALYGDRGGDFNYDGNAEIVKPSKGYIWDYCSRSNVTYRSYGEFASRGEANITSLENHVPKDYPSFDMSVFDTARERMWEHDFDSLFALNAVPQFQTIRLSNDHTSGARAKMPTPESAVADNDLAVGKLIDHLSHSKIWNESVVFILEDDAQDGPDHVDAHRSTAYVAGGMVKRNIVDHTMYSTSSVLHTIELILHLPPMSQYDASATPMWRCFSARPYMTAYTVIPNNIPLDEKNPPGTELAALSSHIDLSEEDRVPDDFFSEIIWKTVKGEDAVMPTPRHATFVFYTTQED